MNTTSTGCCCRTHILCSLRNMVDRNAHCKDKCRHPPDWQTNGRPSCAFQHSSAQRLIAPMSFRDCRESTAAKKPQHKSWLKQGLAHRNNLSICIFRKSFCRSANSVTVRIKNKYRTATTPNGFLIVFARASKKKACFNTHKYSTERNYREQIFSFLCCHSELGNHGSCARRGAFNRLYQQQQPKRHHVRCRHLQ